MSLFKYFVLIAVMMLSFVGYQVYTRGFYTLLGKQNFERISAKQAQKLLTKKTFTILDVRDEKEFMVSHLSGAKRFEDIMLKKLDRNIPILVYCTVGVRSNKLANKLLDEGFTEVLDMKDGIIGWSNAKFPIVNQDNELTDSVHVYSEYFGLLLKKGIPVY